MVDITAATIGVTITRDLATTAALTATDTGVQSLTDVRIGDTLSYQVTEGSAGALQYPHHVGIHTVTVASLTEVQWALEPYFVGVIEDDVARELLVGLAHSMGAASTWTASLRRGATVIDATFHETLIYTPTDVAADRAAGGIYCDVNLTNGTDSLDLTLEVIPPVQLAVFTGMPNPATPAVNPFGDTVDYDIFTATGAAGSTTEFDVTVTQGGDLFVAVWGGGSGGTMAKLETKETSYGGRGGNGGEAIDFQPRIVAAGVYRVTIGAGGLGAASGDEFLSQVGGTSTYGEVGGTTSAFSIVARGGQLSTDGSETYSPGASPAGYSRKGGGAGNGSNGEDALTTRGGNGGTGHAITFGTTNPVVTTVCGGGGASGRDYLSGNVGGAGTDGGGNGQTRPSGQSLTVAQDATAGSGGGGGGAANWNGSAAVAAAGAGNGAGGGLMIAVEV